MLKCHTTERETWTVFAQRDWRRGRARRGRGAAGEAQLRVVWCGTF
eukprot:COSAG06_NODE_1256_length_10087_cov_7.646676_1_plen_46_part_00